MNTTLLLSFLLCVFSLNRIYSQSNTPDSETIVGNLSKSYVFSYLSNVDQEKAIKIKDFTLKRKGVVLCDVNIVEKTITIGIDNSLNANSANYLMDVIRRKFLDAVDAPKEKDAHNHKH